MLVERDNIGIFGKMNSGKSSIMNLLTQQQASIVDSTPGTTSDTKQAVMEIHSLGPVRLFDTAGADEKSPLGIKKQKKVYDDLAECDLVLITIDPSTKKFCTEKQLIHAARELDKQVIIIFNIFDETDKKKIDSIEKRMPLMRFYRKITINATDKQFKETLIQFIINNYESKNTKINLLPFVEKGEYYILNIPMDTETPKGRYLRPQAMTEEYITRNWAYPISFRMDLAKARSRDEKDRLSEKQRFLDFISNSKKRPKAIITDSQAMDIMKAWVPDDIMLTTFSIAMINYFSKGKLIDFAEGIIAINELKKGDRVLIVEACNHSRDGADIGTVQIPAFFRKYFSDVSIDYNYGREFQENEALSKYKLIIHCGGCMISSQKLLARMRDLKNLEIPYTNYGIFLSYMQGENALKKVLLPWKINSI